MLKEGSVLTYEVRSGGTTYDFIVTITSLEEGISFDYEMTAPANLEGSVTIAKDAMDNAFAMVNYFRGGELVLKDATTVFLCRECYERAKTGELSLTLDGADEPTILDAVEPGYSHTLEINGEEQDINCTWMYNQSWDEEEDDVVIGDQLIVMKDSEYPLILAMWLDFSIQLKAADNVDLRP